MNKSTKKDSSKNITYVKTSEDKADSAKCNSCGQYVAMKDRDSHANTNHSGNQSYSYFKSKDYGGKGNDPYVGGKPTEVKNPTIEELGYSGKKLDDDNSTDNPNIPERDPEESAEIEAANEGAQSQGQEDVPSIEEGIENAMEGALAQGQEDIPEGAEEAGEISGEGGPGEAGEIGEGGGDKKENKGEAPDKGKQSKGEAPDETEEELESADKTKTDSKAGPKVKVSDKLKGEFVMKIDSNWRKDDDGLHFSGILTMPRMSLNGWIYFPQELAAQDGKAIPLFINHEEMFDDSIMPRGMMTVSFDESTWELRYDAIATDQDAIDGITSGRFQSMSMGADWGDYDYIRGYYIPKDIVIKEGSLVDSPGVIGTSVNYVDHFRGDGKPQSFEKCKFNCRDSLKSSLEHGSASVKSITMSDAKNTNDKTKPETPKTSSTKIDATYVDAKELGKIFADSMTESNKTLLEGIDKIIQSKVETEKPQGAVDQKVTVENQRKAFYDAVTNSLKVHQSLNWDSIKADFQKKAGIGLDAIDPTALGTAQGQEWLEDITIIPSGLRAGLRSTTETVIIQRGASDCHFTLISTPAPANGSAPTIPADVAQTITDVIATPVERIVKQRLTDQAARFTQINLGQAIADTFRIAEMLDEDLNILTTLDGIVVGNLAGVIFAGGVAAENLITSTMYLTHNLLAQARAKISKQGWAEALIPGRLACAMSPEQMEQLMVDNNVQRFIEWVSNGTNGVAPIVDGFIPRLHGVDLYVTSQLPVGSGAGSPPQVTQHAYVFVKTVAVGLGFTKDLTIETARYPEQRATTIVGTWEIASATKAAGAVCRIVTANTLA